MNRHSLVWHASRHSRGHGQAPAGGRHFVPDAKDPDIPVPAFPPDDWRALLAAIAGGDLPGAG